MSLVAFSGFDILSFIPFTIILVIPLTPVGQLLAFNFIQVLHTCSIFHPNGYLLLMKFDLLALRQNPLLALITSKTNVGFVASLPISGSTQTSFRPASRKSAQT